MNGIVYRFMLKNLWSKMHRGSVLVFCFFFQAEDGIRDLVRSRGLGDVYKRQEYPLGLGSTKDISALCLFLLSDESKWITGQNIITVSYTHLTLPTIYSV